MSIQTGKILTTQTGGFYNMVPRCYGFIAANGVVVSATPNVTAAHINFGTYRIRCAGITASSILIVTATADAQCFPKHTTDKYIANGEMEVLCVNLRNYLTHPEWDYLNDSPFYFVIYN